jgi:TPP-dependent pyruvate/acetoin dehydrogenase alpha subunit
LTYRVREHVGPLFDYDRGYRTKEEVDAWVSKCPIKRFKKKLIDENVMTAVQIEEEETKWKVLSDNAYDKALKSPWPLTESLLNNVY